MAEIEETRTDKGLWARCFAESDGDHEKAKASYIRQRVAVLAQSGLSNDDAIGRAPKPNVVASDISQSSTSRRKKWLLSENVLKNVLTEEVFFVVDKLPLYQQEVRRDGRGYIFSPNKNYSFVSDREIEIWPLKTR